MHHPLKKWSRGQRWAIHPYWNNAVCLSH